MTGFFSPQVRYALLALAFAVTLSVPPVHALELWTTGVPELPPEAEGTTTSRTVTHRNGSETVARARRFDRLTQLAVNHVAREVYDERGRYLWTTEFECDGDRLVSVRAADGDDLRWVIRFEYDEEGRVLRETYTTPSGDEQRIVVYDYSVDQTEIVSYRGDGTVAWRRSETAGSIQDERETTYFYADGSRVKTIVAVVDDRGRATSEQHYDELGAVYRLISRGFDGDRPVEEVVRDDTGSVIRRTQWRYNPRGRLVERTVDLPIEAVVERLSIEYEFDERGNWVRQIHTVVAEVSGDPPIIADRFFLDREIDYQ
ncbi:MAG: hypothetical protein ACOC0O_01580 [Spirochaetota bacterium]